MTRLTATTVLALALAAVVGGLVGCTSEPGPLPSSLSSTERATTERTPTEPAPVEQPATTPATDPAPVPVASPTLLPGALCDPAAGSPDCTDASVDGGYRFVVGYADCVALMDTAPELCTDLDGDGHQGYPDE